MEHKVQSSDSIHYKHFQVFQYEDGVFLEIAMERFCVCTTVVSGSSKTNTTSFGCYILKDLADTDHSFHILTCAFL